MHDSFGCREVWEVRSFTGSDAQGQLTQLSRTVHGGKRDAIDAWASQSLGTWAPLSARDLQSRGATIKKDPIGRIPLARGTVGDVERSHTRMRNAGFGDASVRNQRRMRGRFWRRRFGGSGPRATWRRSPGCGRSRRRPGGR